jgi:hypothetical protein
MYYWSVEEFEQCPVEHNPVTLTKQQHNDGACHVNSNAERAIAQSNDDEEFRPKKKWQRILAMYEVVKCARASSSCFQTRLFSSKIFL